MYIKGSLHKDRNTDGVTIETQVEYSIFHAVKYSKLDVYWDVVIMNSCHIALRNKYFDTKYLFRCKVFISMQSIYFDAKYLFLCEINTSSIQKFLSLRNIYCGTKYLFRIEINTLH